ncbi:MAG: hypothetical protein V3W14_06320, partial [Candidatus Neomarinimicrobiota bacterium]
PKEPPPDARYYRIQGYEAYQAGDFQRFLANYQQAQKLVPNHPAIIYNVAAGHALTGHADSALVVLNRLAGMNLSYPIEVDDDFAALKSEPGFRAVVDKMRANMRHHGTSTGFLTLPEKAAHFEGLAFDAFDGVWYFSAIHQPKIVVRDRDGKYRDFATASRDGLWSILGLQVDNRRQLWAVGGPMAQMLGYADSLDGAAGVYRFDLETGDLVWAYLLKPNPDERHGFNDLAVASDGTVYITDGMFSGIFIIDPKVDRLQLFLEPGTIRSAQGIVLTPEEKYLLVADYSQGLWRVDRSTGEAVLMSLPENATLIGLDGLMLYRNSLIGIQNGVRPFRVIRAYPNADYSAISRMEILESNHPLFGEPTLGQIVNDRLYYMANSPWGRYHRGGAMFSPDSLDDQVVLKLRL